MCDDALDISCKTLSPFFSSLKQSFFQISLEKCATALKSQPIKVNTLLKRVALFYFVCVFPGSWENWKREAILMNKRMGLWLLFSLRKVQFFSFKCPEGHPVGLVESVPFTMPASSLHILAWFENKLLYFDLGHFLTCFLHSHQNAQAILSFSLDSQCWPCLLPSPHF